MIILILIKKLIKTTKMGTVTAIALWLLPPNFYEGANYCKKLWVLIPFATAD